MSTDQRVLSACRSVPALDAAALVSEAPAVPWDPSDAAPTLKDLGNSQCLWQTSV